MILHDHEPNWNWKHAIIGIALAILIVWMFTHPAAQAATRYVEPGGNTFQDVLYQSSPGDTIIATPGYYYGQSAIVRKSDITIRCAVPRACILDGDGARLAFQLTDRPSACTNLVVEGFVIMRYQEYGILLHGERNGDWNGCNTIRDNVFIANGSWQCPGTDCAGFAAVDVVNSRDNVIEDNLFVRNGNRRDDVQRWHDVYLAHGSTGNTVRTNIIRSSSGNPVKVRDASNDNIFDSNDIKDSGQRSSFEDRPSGNERRSKDNILRDNQTNSRLHWTSSNSYQYTSCTKEEDNLCTREQFIIEGESPVPLPPKNPILEKCLAKISKPDSDRDCRKIDECMEKKDEPFSRRSCERCIDAGGNTAFIRQCIRENG